MGVEALLTRYALAARAEGLSPKTVSHVRLGVRLFDDFLGGVPDVRKISGDDLRRFIVALQQRPKWQGMRQSNGQKISPTAINTYTRAVKSFWSWLLREGIIKTNPLAAVPAPKLPKKLPKVYSEDELAKVLKVAAQNDRDYAIVNLFLDSGIRLSELVDLSPDDVQDDRVKVFGKGGKERIAFVSEETRFLITSYYVDSRPEPVGDNKLFLTEDGRPLTADRVQKMLAQIGKRAGIATRLSPHRLRHSYATLSLKHGANLEYVRRTLGHTDIKTTEIYLGLTDADVAEAYRKFSPVTNLMAKKVR